MMTETGIYLLNSGDFFKDLQLKLSAWDTLRINRWSFHHFCGQMIIGLGNSNKCISTESKICSCTCYFIPYHTDYLQNKQMFQILKNIRATHEALNNWILNRLMK